MNIGAKDPAGPVVACPTCKGPSRFAPSNPWRPFCSERCRTVDLGAWASEQFRVPEAQGQPGNGDVETDHLGGAEGTGPHEPHAH
jgi:uncharacterized protein